MQDLLGTSLGVFLGLTLIITGGAAVMTGRALADGWKSPWSVVLACLGLAIANRFLIYALFEGPLLHLVGFLVNYAAIAGLALAAYRLTAVRKMVSQYPWRYEQVSLWSYRERAAR